MSKIPISAAALLITIPYGLKAVVIGHFIDSVICFFINAYYPGKMFGFGAMRQIREMKTVVIATLIMSACVFGTFQLISMDFFKVFVGATLGVLTYLISAYLLKIEELNEIRRMAQFMFIKVKGAPAVKTIQ